MGKQVGPKQNLLFMWPEQNDLLEVYWWKLHWEAVLRVFEEEKYLTACKMFSYTYFQHLRILIGIRGRVGECFWTCSKQRHSANSANKKG